MVTIFGGGGDGGELWSSLEEVGYSRRMFPDSESNVSEFGSVAGM